MITTDFLLYWASCISEEEAPRTKSLVWRKSRERRRHAGAAHGYCVSLQRCHTSSDCLFQDVTQGSRSIFAFQCQALSPACSHLLKFGEGFFPSVMPTQEPVILVGKPEGHSKFVGFASGCQDWPHGVQAEEDIPKGNLALTWYKCYHLMQECSGAVADNILLQEKSNINEFL